MFRFIEKVVVLIFGFSFLSHISVAQNEGTVVVEVDGIPNPKGQMIVALHESAENFPKSPILKYFGTIEKGKSIVLFQNIKYGTYAVTVIHDINENGKIDFNWFHMPIENTGASNNAKGFLGPPKYIDAKFGLNSGEKIIQIQLVEAN